MVRRFVQVLALALLVSVTAVAASPSTAAAQDDTPEQVNSNAKGIIGLGLIGAELGFVIPAAAGLHETWAFIVFPVVGAVGGGLAGHFAIEQNNQTEVAVAMLAAGLALVVPATVLTVHFTTYDPRRDEPSPPPEAGPGGEETAEADGPRLTYASAPTPTLRLGDAVARSGMFRLADRGLELGLPGFSLSPDLDRRQANLYGVDATVSVLVPVVSGSF